MAFAFTQRRYQELEPPLSAPEEDGSGGSYAALHQSSCILLRKRKIRAPLSKRSLQQCHIYLNHLLPPA
jgi:hypothetical protein